MVEIAGRQPVGPECVVGFVPIQAEFYGNECTPEQGREGNNQCNYVGTAPEYLHDYLNRELGYPMGLNAGLGLDPTGDAFGSIRFDAEVAGRDGLDTADHSHYYDSGSESLRAMTYIATGETDPLAEEGLLYGRKLLAAGTDVTPLHYGGAIHGFVTIGPDAEVSRKAFSDMVERIAAVTSARP